MVERMSPLLTGILQGRHPADTHSRRGFNGSPEQDLASFVNGSPIAQIEQAHVLSPEGGSNPEETVVLQRPPPNGGTPRNERAPGKYYIKNAALATNLSNQ